jgi:hypothetical protein
MTVLDVQPNKGADMPETPTPPVPPATTQPDRRHPSFIRDHFAVLVVFACFCLMLGVYVMEVHTTGNDAILLWLQNKMSDLISAMLMGLTGAGIKTVIGSK